MGIQGLLPLLKSIQKPCNLKQFAGQTLGVDAYGWLHRGTVSCAVELATGKPTTKYVDFAMSRVRMLKHFGITPYLIFDGDYLPSKSKTEKERSARRKDARKLGLELLALGKTSQAHLELQKAVDVTPEMAGLLIEELKRNGVQYVVAPYEADSQMVYLERTGVIDGILSEDSDLLVFGAKKLLTKLDQYGECVMIRRDDFTACREVSFVGWSDTEFRQMAIMSGCDYLNSIEKMGLKTAHRLLRKHKSMERVVRALQFDGKFKVPVGYLDAFGQAELTFLHQWVYCPKAKELIHLTPLADGTTVEDLPFIGKHVDPKLATGVARGHLHPHTKQPLQLPAVPVRRWGNPPPTKKPALVETPELKKHKSIDSFFKPARTPLAELDINLFTGSPSQQEMARRASGSSWPATPVDIATPVSALTQSVPAPASAPLAARGTVSNTAASHTAASARAPKRPRLCADGSSPVSRKNADRIEYGASRFFGGLSAASQTPSKRTKSSKIAKRTDFTLWSDDSVDEALSQLPMPDAAPPKATKKKLDVFEDQDAAAIGIQQETESIVVSAQETQVSTMSTVFSQGAEKGASCEPESPPSEFESESETPIDANLRAEISDLRSRFSFGVASVSKAPKSRNSQSFAKDEQLRGTMKANSKDKRKPSTSVLQVDGACEIHNEKKGEPIERSGEEQIIVPGSDSIEAPSSSPIKPSPRISDTGQRKLQPACQSTGVGGSEDLLVSESEADEISEPGTPRATGFSMSLARFAFGAA